MLIIIVMTQPVVELVVTDCGVRGLGCKSPGSILTSRIEPVLYHEWSGMVGTHALCR